MDTENSSAWGRFKSWLNAEDIRPEVREGSVGSAGGDSLLPGALPPARPTTAPMSVEAALSMSSVFRATNIISTAIQQLELRVERAGKAMASSPAIITKPDVDSSLSAFLDLTTTSLTLHGNAFWYIQRADKYSPVTDIKVLNPSQITITYNKAGDKVYNYSPIPGNGKTIELADWQIKHLKYMRVWHSDYGLGPIQAARVELEGMAVLRDYSNKLFSNGGVPRGVLSTTNNIDKATAEEYGARLNEMIYGYGNAVLGNGMSYTPVMLKPADAQFLESQNFDVQKVARMFGVPAPYLLADGGNSMTYQNMIQVETQFLRYTLSLYIKEIEEAFTDLLPRGQKARFNVQGFLRADELTRAQVNKTYVDMGALSVQEIRDMEGWGDMPADLKNKPVVPVVPQNNNDTGGNTNNGNS